MADFPAPKPFYRSRLFWLGVPGLLFLLWVELGFRGRVVDGGIAIPKSYIVSMVVGDSDLVVQYIDVSPIRHQGPHGWNWQFEERSTKPYSGPVFRIFALPKNG